MPPTKFALERSAVWWRKWFKIEVKQRLYPQCTSCCSLQGEAVRKGIHTLVYHYGLRPCHFAVCMTLYIMEENPFDVVNYVDKFEEFLKIQSKSVLATAKDILK